jgi:HEAT repeat protein
MLLPAPVLTLLLLTGGGDATLLRAVGQGTHPEVEAAIDRIAFLGTPRPIVGGLLRMARGEEPGSAENAIYALAVLHPPEAAPAFVALLDSTSAPVRLGSCQGLLKLPPPRGGAKPVAARLQDPVPAVRRDCARVLAAWSGAKQGAALSAALGQEKDGEARLAEIDALGHAPSPGARKVLEPMLSSTEGALRLQAALALVRLGEASGRKAMEAELSALEVQPRVDAVEKVATLSTPWATAALATRLDDPAARVCIRAARALAARKDPRGVETLILRAERASPDDKFAFEAALGELHVTQAQRLDTLQRAQGK